MPEGADAVVQIEDTEQLPAGAAGSARVRIVQVAARGPVLCSTSTQPEPCTCAPVQAAAKAGQDVRAVGSDIQAGQLVLPAGTLLGPAEIGILATVGAAELQVCARASSCEVRPFPSLCQALPGLDLQRCPG